MTGDSWNNGTFTKEYVKRIRKWLIAGGAASILVGLLVLCRPVHSVAVFTVVLAVWFVLLGIARIASALTVKGMPAGWRTLEALAGVFLVASGCLAGRYALLSAGVLLLFTSILIGISWIFEGVLALFESAGPLGRLWSALSSALSIAGGVVVLAWPIGSITLLLRIAGIALVVYGAAAIARGARLKS